MCKQTRESPEMAGDLQVSLKCTKMSRNRDNFLDLDVQLPEKNSPSIPPPQRTWSAFGDHGKFRLLPPPPANLVGFWRSRKIYRVASAGWPPPRNKNPGYAVEGGIQDCANYIGIKMIYHTMKIWKEHSTED